MGVRIVRMSIKYILSLNPVYVYIMRFDAQCKFVDQLSLNEFID